MEQGDREGQNSTPPGEELKYNTLLNGAWDIQEKVHRAQERLRSARETRDSHEIVVAAADAFAELADTRVALVEWIETLRQGSPLQAAALERERRKREARKK